MVAADSGYIAAMEKLLEAGADVPLQDAKGATALTHALSNGEEDAAALLRAHGARESLQDRFHSALKRADVEAAAEAVNKGVNLQAHSVDGLTALHLAYGDGRKKGPRTELMELLLSQGAAVDAKDSAGRTVALHAAHRGDLKGLQFLERHGADLLLGDTAGFTPLIIAAQNGRDELVTFLLDKGVDPNAASPGGRTPLLAAANNGHRPTIDLLLKRGADPNKANSKGWTPLMVACRQGYDEAAHSLLQGNAEVNLTDSDGWTALMSTAYSGDIQLVEELLKRGADVDAVNNDGWTAFNFALEAEATELARHLIHKGAPVNAAARLTLGVLEHHPKSITQAAERGADPNLYIGRFPAVVKACQLGFGHRDVVMALLSAGAWPGPKASKDIKAQRDAVKGVKEGPSGEEDGESEPHTPGPPIPSPSPRATGS